MAEILGILGQGEDREDRYSVPQPVRKLRSTLTCPGVSGHEWEGPGTRLCYSEAEFLEYSTYKDSWGSYTLSRNSHSHTYL